MIAQDIIPPTIFNTEHDLFNDDLVVIDSNPKVIGKISKYRWIKLQSSTIGRPLLPQESVGI